MKWLTVACLILDMAGALTMAAGVIITDKEARQVGAPRLPLGDSDEHLDKLPAVRSLVRDSRLARLEPCCWRLAPCCN